MIKINDKVKEFLKGFIVVLTISAFTFIVVKIYTEKSDAKHQVTLQEINRKAELREQNAIKARDEAKQSDRQNLDKLEVIQKDLNVSQLNWNKFQKDYLKNINELNKLKDEKIYVNDNATVTEQSAYISNYKYKPY